jgi:hypothetical protein
MAAPPDEDVPSGAAGRVSDRRTCRVGTAASTFSATVRRRTVCDLEHTNS